MKLGFMCDIANKGQSTIDELKQEIVEAEKLGFDQAWVSQVFGLDAITTLAIIGRETKRINLGTAVTPSYPRHPTSLAMQVLTANAASEGRFELGLGLSHKMVIEDMFGIPYETPAKHMEEYLQVLMPLTRGEACSTQGDIYNVNASLQIKSEPVPVLIAALGKRMLEVAGKYADGTTTWMTGFNTLKSHTIPTINKAAEKAQRPKPRIVAGLPIVLTENVKLASEILNKKLGFYAHIPSYKNMLNIEGTKNPSDIALVGNESYLTEKLQELKSLGVTDFNAFCQPTDEEAIDRTMAFLANSKSHFS